MKHDSQYLWIDSALQWTTCEGRRATPCHWGFLTFRCQVEIDTSKYEREHLAISHHRNGYWESRKSSVDGNSITSTNEVTSPSSSSSTSADCNATYTLSVIEILLEELWRVGDHNYNFATLDGTHPAKQARLFKGASYYGGSHSGMQAARCSFVRSAPQIERNTTGNHFLPLSVRGARFGASKLVGLSFCTCPFVKVEDF